MIRTPLLAALTLLVAAPSLPQAANAPAAAEARAYRPIEAIRWAYGEESFPDGSAVRLRFEHDRSRSNLGPEDHADVQRILDRIAGAAPGEAISFDLAREAGTLACTGRAEAGGGASGTCRFDPDEGFAAELASRGIAPENSDEMFGLTLVDARLATLDSLTAEGFRFRQDGDFIAVSALGVTSAYARELRGGGLRIDELSDLIAAKALKIDRPWLDDMARAGYPDLEVGKAIQMRALGVTPDYAVRMSRVLHAIGEIE